MLGRAKKVLIDKESTTIVEVAGRKYDIEGRRDQIRGQIDQTTNKDDLEKLRERLEKLTRGIAVIRVGGATDVEIEERKDRAVYALRRTRAAFEEGIVPGGGVALARASLGLANLKSRTTTSASASRLFAGRCNPHFVRSPRTPARTALLLRAKS